MLLFKPEKNKKKQQKNWSFRSWLELPRESKEILITCLIQDKRIMKA